MKIQSFFLIIIFLAIGRNAATQTEVGFSGSWEIPGQSGSSILVEVGAVNSGLLYWLTYDDLGQQQWYVGIATVDNNTLLVPDLLHVSGGRFGMDDLGGATVFNSVGHVTITFTDCQTASIQYSLAGIESTQPLQKLTGLLNANCNHSLAIEDSNDLSGAWYNTARPNEVFAVQETDLNQAIVAWMTTNENGQQVWRSGVGRRSETTIHVEEILKSSGGRFTVDAAEAVFTVDGQLQLQLSCSQAIAVYDLDGNKSSSGATPLQRFSSIRNLGCNQDIFRPALLDDIQGIWISEGFGYVAQIASSEIQLFQYTSESCLEVLNRSLNDTDLKAITINQNKDRVQLSGLDSVTPVAFTRSSILPSNCSNGGTGFSNDPVTNFDVFAATYGELYASFEKRNVDWNLLIAQYRPLVSASTSDLGLFEIMASMLSELNDSHVNLTSSFNFHRSEVIPELDALYLRAISDDVTSLIEKTYLDGQVIYRAGGKLRYGMLEENIGYLEVYSLNNIYDSLAREESISRWENDLDDVFNYFTQSKADSVVIDVRRNTGGDSAFGLLLASRFLQGKRRLVMTESYPIAKSADRFSTPYELFIEPSSRSGFQGKLILLTSRITSSAAEIFTLAMNAIPRTIVMGQASHGILSRTERVLPNGWIASITAGIVRAPDGAHYEVKGIPVDEETTVFDAFDIAQGRDTSLDSALRRLAQ